MEEQINLTEQQNSDTGRYWGMEEKNFLLLLHLGQLAGLIVPYVGFILPVVMWLTNKDNNQNIDAHGRIILNWLISATIYAIGAAILIFVIIGIPLLVAIGIMSIVFPIMGAVKVNKGEMWKYPLSIKFFK